MTETDDRQTEKPWPPSLSLSPRACGACKARRLTGRSAQHQECSMRAVLAKAPDHPCYETLLDLTYAQRQALPARFHVPVWDGDGVPHAWLCAVCWDDGVVTSWPCTAAVEHGAEVFER